MIEDLNNVNTIEQRLSRTSHEAFTHTFSFPDRSVTGLVIASPHGGEEDTQFILSRLSQEGSVFKKTLFVEQGSGRQTDHLTSQLQDLAKKNLTIAQDFNAKIAEGFSSPAETADTPFAQASDFWMNNGGRVVNFDLSGNLSTEALDFLLSEISPESVIRFVRNEVWPACHSKRIVPDVVKHFLPQFHHSLIEKQCRSLSSPFEGSDQRTMLREKYMRRILQEQMKSNDIVLAHPNHIRRIITLDAA